MKRRPHEVLATREAREQLPSLLAEFREAGAEAEPVVIGARRRPEGVVLSYERYPQLLGGRERLRTILTERAAGGEGMDDDEALRLAVDEQHAARR
jgi:antitoxin StbD